MEENKIVIYQTDDGQTQIDVRLENDTVWLNTSQMSILFDREESNIRRHIINVFKEGELVKENNVHFLHVNGVKKPVPFYTLDVIISVGYISDLWRQGTLSQRRGESGHAALPRHEEPFVQRRQQTHCRHALPVVSQRQPHSLSCRRFKAYSRQHPRCTHPDDCLEPHRGKGRYGESGCKFDKSAELGGE